MISKRETFWKEKHYQTVEKGNGWKIERPVEIKPLEDLLDGFFKKRTGWFIPFRRMLATRRIAPHA